MESASRCCAKPCTALPFGLVRVPEMPRMPERSSVAVMMSVVSPPSRTWGGSNAIERSCGGVVSEFGSCGSFDGVFGCVLEGWVDGDAVDGFELKALMIGWRSLLIVDCGFTSGGGGAVFAVDCTVTVGGAGVAGFGAPSASNSRSFCAREIEVADDVFGGSGDENVPFA